MLRGFVLYCIAKSKEEGNRVIECIALYSQKYNAAWITTHCAGYLLPSFLMMSPYAGVDVEGV